mmetsp:Transcript_17974/g.34253  ORF Transcript_17974/g.34253 Transcript_17974/m.34253 type:complete len:212 (+) Transcript_17974:736-1371(+)
MNSELALQMEMDTCAWVGNHLRKGSRRRYSLLKNHRRSTLCSRVAAFPRTMDLPLCIPRCGNCLRGHDNTPVPLDCIFLVDTTYMDPHNIALHNYFDNIPNDLVDWPIARPPNSPFLHRPIERGLPAFLRIDGKCVEAILRLLLGIRSRHRLFLERIDMPLPCLHGERSTLCLRTCHEYPPMVRHRVCTYSMLHNTHLGSPNTEATWQNPH